MGGLVRLNKLSFSDTFLNYFLLSKISIFFLIFCENNFEFRYDIRSIIYVSNFDTILDIDGISYINVQKSTDFKPQEKRERKTGHACSWGAGVGQIGRKKERKIDKS